MLTTYRPGAFGISFGLPLLVYVLTFFCNDISGCPAPSLLHPSSLKLDQLKREVGWTGFSGLLNWQALLGTLSYYLLSLTLWAFLPADKVDGVEQHWWKAQVSLQWYVYGVTCIRRQTNTT
jgi:delta14-sterol reductase